LAERVESQVLNSSLSMIQIANAPCSWGVLEFDLQGEAAGCAQVLDEIRATGYAGTELGDWGFMPTEPAKLAAELGKRELALLGAFVPVRWAEPSMHAEALEIAVKTASLMRDAGFADAFIVLADDNGTDRVRSAEAGRVLSEQGWTSAEWKAAGKAINHFAGQIREETGLRSAFHHHAGGYVETPREVQCLLDETDPDLVGLVLDTGHYAFGGGDALDVLKKVPDRIWHVHFKDFHAGIAERGRVESWDYLRSVQEGVFCKLGAGQVDFRSFADELRDQNYDGWIVVEQDVLPGMGDPKACAQHNRDYLKGLSL
jgi:inosose dehydratase